jgi:methionyl-tRNA formyltransferase
MPDRHHHHADGRRPGHRRHAAGGREAIRPDDTTASLHDRLAALGGSWWSQALAAPDALHRTPQPAEGITYAHKIDKAEAAIDWAQPAAVIERRVRAFDPFPGASFSLDGEVVKLWRAALRPDGRCVPGRCWPPPTAG